MGSALLKTVDVKVVARTALEATPVLALKDLFSEAMDFLVLKTAVSETMHALTLARMSKAESSSAFVMLDTSLLRIWLAAWILTSAWKEPQDANTDVITLLEDLHVHALMVKDFVMTVSLVELFATPVKMFFPTTSAMKPLYAQTWRPPAKLRLVLSMDFCTLPKDANSLKLAPTTKFKTH